MRVWRSSVLSGAVGKGHGRLTAEVHVTRKHPPGPLAPPQAFCFCLCRKTEAELRQSHGANFELPARKHRSDSCQAGIPAARRRGFSAPQGKSSCSVRNESTTHVSQQRFLSQSFHQTFCVHLAKTEDVERSPIFKRSTGV